jgi:hypothetical protein
VSPFLATLDDPGRAPAVEAHLALRARQVTELLRETVRLTAQAVAAPSSPLVPPAPQGDREAPVDVAVPALAEFTDRVEQIEAAIDDLQRMVAAQTGERFTASPYLAYRRLVRGVRHAVETLLPRGATAVVISRGDEELVSFAGRTGWHFPQDEDGRYAGYYPSDGETAVAALERLRGRGARYLVIPLPALWWLDHYHALRGHVAARYVVLGDADDSCRVYEAVEA